MIRQSLSPACHALIKELSPAPEAPIRRCRSLDWIIQDRAGERIHIEFELAQDSERERAASLAASAPAALALIGAMLVSLTSILSDNSILFDAVVLWP